MRTTAATTRPGPARPRSRSAPPGLHLDHEWHAVPPRLFELVEAPVRSLAVGPGRRRRLARGHQHAPPEHRAGGGADTGAGHEACPGRAGCGDGRAERAGAERAGARARARSGWRVGGEAGRRLGGGAGRRLGRRGGAAPALPCRRPGTRRCRPARPSGMVPGPSPTQPNVPSALSPPPPGRGRTAAVGAGDTG